MAGPSVGFGHQTESCTRGSRDAQPLRPQQERTIRGQEDLGEQELRHHTGEATPEMTVMIMPICFRSTKILTKHLITAKYMSAVPINVDGTTYKLNIC